MLQEQKVATLCRLTVEQGGDSFTIEFIKQHTYGGLSSVVTSVGILIPRLCLLENTAHMTGEKKSWVACTMAARFPRGKVVQIFCALHWDKKVILSHLISSNLI